MPRTTLRPGEMFRHGERAAHEGHRITELGRGAAGQPVAIGLENSRINTRALPSGPGRALAEAALTDAAGDVCQEKKGPALSEGTEYLGGAGKSSRSSL